MALPDDPPIVLTLVDGARIVLAAGAHLSTSVLLEQEDWFEDEIGFVRELAQPGMVALDIGANHGIYTLALAARLAGSGQVFAFEPDPRPRLLLEESVALNGWSDRVSVMPCALSNFQGQSQLGLSRDSELNSMGASGEVSSIEIEVETLDALDDRLGLARIDFIKIDAEGEEARIVEGGANALRRHSPVILFETVHGTSRNLDLGQRFVELGFELYRLLPGPRILVPLDPEPRFDDFALNIFAIKPDTARALATRNLLVPNVVGQHSLVPPGAREFARALRELPFTRDRMRHWRRAFRWFGTVPQAELPLAAYLMSRNPQRKAAERLGYLRLAELRLAEEMANGDTSIGARVLQVRLLRELGRRADAVTLLNRLVIDFHTGEAPPLDRPLLPPLERFESLDPGAHLYRWLSTALVEAYAEWSQFSCYFGAASIHKALTPIGENPELSPRAKRSLALTSWFLGKPIAAELQQDLEVGALGHRNPDTWKTILGTWLARPPRE